MNLIDVVYMKNYLKKHFYGRGICPVTYIESESKETKVCELSTCGKCCDDLIENHLEEVYENIRKKVEKIELAKQYQEIDKKKKAVEKYFSLYSNCCPSKSTNLNQEEIDRLCLKYPDCDTCTKDIIKKYAVEIYENIKDSLW